MEVATDMSYDAGISMPALIKCQLLSAALRTDLPESVPHKLCLVSLSYVYFQNLPVASKDEGLKAAICLENGCHTPFPKEY